MLAAFLHCACNGCSRVPEPAGASAAESHRPDQASSRAEARLVKPVIVGRTPHDPTSFTQGLIFAGHTFLESTGRYGESSLRRVDPTTGSAVSALALPTKFFGEGLARSHGELFQLTWREHVCLVYDEATLMKRRELAYDGEGWGLTSDRDGLLIMSDGSAVLRFLESASFHEVRRVTVSDGEHALARLNELEWVRGEILANVWQTSMIARVDPSSGRVRGYIDLSGLPEPHPDDDDEVLNGIAYDDTDGRLFVTGKRWTSVFEITLPDE
jgi:glutaminyl-peptide cyclotransferase